MPPEQARTRRARFGHRRFPDEPDGAGSGWSLKFRFAGQYCSGYEIKPWLAADSKRCRGTIVAAVYQVQEAAFGLFAAICSQASFNRCLFQFGMVRCPIDYLQLEFEHSEHVVASSRAASPTMLFDLDHDKWHGADAASVMPRYVMRLLVLLAIILAAPGGARACELSLVAPTSSVLKKPVQARASLADDTLTVSFSVSEPSLNARRVLGPRQYPYMFDVVELFVTFSEAGFPYYEFEVSPYNQTFQVKIVSHTEPFQEGIDLGLVSAATISPRDWHAQLKIPLKPLGWDGNPSNIRGNFYTILQRAPKRSFWSAFLPKADKPNFHQPQFFQPLLQCD